MPASAHRRPFHTARRLAAASLSAAAFGFAPGATAQSNVVVIITDDAGWADFGFMDPVTGGNTPMVTPNLDALAAQGVVFSNAYTGAVCAQSRASIATGQYGGRFGHENNILGSSAVIGTTLTQGVPTEIKTTFEYMKDLNYTTGVVGKWHLGEHRDNVQGGNLVQAGNRPSQQGVDEFFGLLSGGRSYFVGSQTGSGALSTETLSPNGTSNNVTVENQYVGEYVTDLFGEKSAQFIADHANDADPFFLYHSFTSPHTPVNTNQILQSDFNDPRIAGITNTNRRILAANMLAMDRAVGTILDALDDPNGDGDTADSVRDDTLILFINDNGGDCCDNNGINYANNGPLKNGKGTNWEGGIRVPMVIAGAGIDPAKQGTIFDAPVHSIDITATAFESAGGGTFAPTDVIDGVNLIPYINGTQTGDPHESIFLRRPGAGQVAVRAGDWKLYHRDADGFLLFDVVNDRGETNNRAGDFPELVEALKRAMTGWEVQMDKNRVDNNAPSVNQFNAFRFREGAFADTTFSAADAWINADNGAAGPATMTDLDSFSGMELVFRNRNNSDWTITNDLTRNSGLAFMANRITFINRNENLTGNATGTVTGLPILLAKNALNGDMPTLALDASRPGPNVFTYVLDTDLELYDDLSITGNGDQAFVVSGDIREYREGRSITKTGTSTVRLSGTNTLTGEVRVEQGKLIADAAAALGQADLFVADGATLESLTPVFLANGRTLAGSGTLDTALLINQANVAPGNSPGVLQLTGNYTQTGSGELTIQITNTTPGSGYDRLDVDGAASLNGTLSIDTTGYSPQPGDVFTILTADTVSGQFQTIQGDTLGGQLALVPVYNPTSVQLQVVSVAIPGDTDGDGDIDDSDLGTAFANYTGPLSPGTGGKTSAQGDTDGDGDIDDSDLGTAFANYTGPLGPSTVPEPGGFAATAGVLFLLSRRRR
ncbi:MAG: sulfatase-like hydrolase/transferase [Phycisphaeraceae bacterium]